jgi:hypothetical protein
MIDTVYCEGCGASHALGGHLFTDFRRKLKVRQGQHCTSKKCPYTFSHTGEWCGYKQKRKCGCPFCYTEETK